MGKINRNTNYKYIIMNTKDPIELLAVNARLVSKQHPETFKLFSEEHLNHINSGDCVKIIHNGEAPKFSNLIQVHNYCNEPIFLNTYLKYSN